jgi:hypothetical protein
VIFNLGYEKTSSKTEKEECPFVINAEFLALTRSSSNSKLQTRPLVREGVTK